MADTHRPAPPEIPGYRTLKEIGRGGISTVYLAVQESLGRQVALKIMAPALAAEPNFGERFVREGRTVAQLSHPNIITIFDIGANEYHNYIAMEYVSGGSLKSRMQKKINPDWAMAVVRQVAMALEYAHRKGFVHRDVKPENILFQPDGTAVLTDFGIAKSVSSNTQLTSAGTVIGTPRYMSPEQADGRGADPRSDIYSLGVILFEMLARRPPYSSVDSIALLYAHINDPIPQLPPEQSDFQPLIDTMMAKKLEDRVPDCATLVDIFRVVQHTDRAAREGVAKSAAKAIKESGRRPAAIRPSKRTTAVGSNSDIVITRDQDPDATFQQTIRQAAPVMTWGVIMTAVLIILAVVGSILLFPDQDEGPGDLRPAQNEALTPTQPEEVDAAEPATVERIPVSDPAPKPAPLAVPARKWTPQQVPIREIPVKPAPQAKPRASIAPARPPRPQISDQLLAGLLARAKKQLAADQLSHPPGDNALQTYRELLAQVPDHPDGLAGLNKIAERYLVLAKEKRQARQYRGALLYIKRGLAARPDHAGLQRAKRKITAYRQAIRDFRQAEKLYNERRGEKKYRKRAYELYRRAARAGHGGAQLAYGVMLANGDVGDRDEDQAIRWIRKSATQNNLAAQFNLALGLIYGPSRDVKEAAKIIFRLSDKEYVPAYRVLGWMYTTGIGTERRLGESVKWNAKGIMGELQNSNTTRQREVVIWKRKFESDYKATMKDYESDDS